MKIYSYSGASGTGKSTSALQFAFDHQIEGIIDDGLFIVRGEKVAGTSAKFEKNTITAVRRAIFDDDAHKKEVVDAIQNANIHSIVIIGTSDKMTKKIAKRLDLGQIEKFYYVEDVRTAKEIQMARFVREVQGKHVMPVPYRQVEQNFFKRLIMRGREIFSSNQEKLGETTIVRPDFHKQTIRIARSVYLDVIKYAILQHTIVAKLVHIDFLLEPIPRIKAEITLATPVNYELPNRIKTLQQQIFDSFYHHFQIEAEVIHIKVLDLEKKRKTAR
jgi:adenylate kinase family enzyme